jgi:hypothetical protein
MFGYIWVILMGQNFPALILDPKCMTVACAAMGNLQALESQPTCFFGAEVLRAEPTLNVLGWLGRLWLLHLYPPIFRRIDGYCLLKDPLRKGSCSSALSGMGF